MEDATPETALELEVIDIISKQKDLELQEHELMQDPRFANFLQAQKKFQSESELFWKAIEDQMIKHNIKNIKGDWGSITVAERGGFDIDTDQLPPRFFKKVPDLKKIGDTFKLEGTPVKGTTPKITKYLMKRIK